MRTLRSEGRAVLVVGLGMSGVATVAFLQREKIRVIAVEGQDEASFRKSSKFAARVAQLVEAGAQVYFGIDGERVLPLLKDVALVVLSPGVSLEGALVGVLRRERVPFVSELELGIELSGAPCVVVTGTNGKSTTVSLIHHLLVSAKVPAILCGNVGTPVLDLLPQGVVDGVGLPPGTMLVVEASSYQLSSCTVLKPKVAVFLNLSENHLERHGTLERYLAAKAQIFTRQTAEDIAVLNLDDPYVQRCQSALKSQLLGFSAKPLASGVTGALVDYRPPAADQVVLQWHGVSERYLCAQSALLGGHNRSNIAAALLAARAVGVSPPALQQALLTFRPLEHRLELLSGAVQGLWLNDSKSTTVAASVVAARAVAEAFPDRKLFLLLGGLAKAGSWEPLAKTLRGMAGRLSGLVYFGRDARLLQMAMSALPVPGELASGVQDAVQRARAHALAGDVVLFSPGCASFDEFRDFEERGAVFKSFVYDAGSSHRHTQSAA